MYSADSMYVFMFKYYNIGFNKSFNHFFQKNFLAKKTLKPLGQFGSIWNFKNYHQKYAELVNLYEKFHSSKVIFSLLMRKCLKIQILSDTSVFTHFLKQNAPIISLTVIEEFFKR